MPKTPGQNQDAFWGPNNRWTWQDIVSLLFIISAVVPTLLTIFGRDDWLIKLPPTSPWALSIPLFTAVVGIVLAIRYRRLARDPIGWKWLAVPVVLAVQWLISSQFHALMRPPETAVSVDTGSSGYMALVFLVLHPLLVVPLAEELCSGNGCRTGCLSSDT